RDGKHDDTRAIQRFINAQANTRTRSLAGYIRSAWQCRHSIRTWPTERGTCATCGGTSMAKLFFPHSLHFQPSYQTPALGDAIAVNLEIPISPPLVSFILRSPVIWRGRKPASRRPR